MRRANVNRIRFLFLNIRNISITTNKTTAAIRVIRLEGNKPVTCLTVPTIIGKIIKRSDTITRAIFSGNDIISLGLAMPQFIYRRHTAVIVAAFSYSFWRCSAPIMHGACLTGIRHNRCFNYLSECMFIRGMSCVARRHLVCCRQIFMLTIV